MDHRGKQTLIEIDSKSDGVLDGVNVSEELEKMEATERERYKAMSMKKSLKLRQWLVGDDIKVNGITPD